MKKYFQVTKSGTVGVLKKINKKQLRLGGNQTKLMMHLKTKTTFCM